MTKNRKKSKEQKKQDMGVLYIRYDKTSICGHLIENLKHNKSYGLSDEILNLIFLSEIVELLSIDIVKLLDIDIENVAVIEHALHQSQKLFSDKLHRAEFQIIHLNRQKNLGTNLSPRSGRVPTLFQANRLI